MLLIVVWIAEAARGLGRLLRVSLYCLGFRGKVQNFKVACSSLQRS